MKRVAIEAIDVAERDNLLNATLKAIAHKRQRPYVQAYLANLDGNLNQLAWDILQGHMPYGRFQAFTIHDPKTRQIHAACLADRIFHHALMNKAGAVFEKAQSDVSYACRIGRGNHAAAIKVQQLLGRGPWFVKVDIQQYFSAIQHNTLYALLTRKFKGEWLLQTWQQIIHAWSVAPGVGLPIATLTSQYFANHYLDGADRLLLEHLKVRGAVRYMDDIFWVCESKEQAKSTLLELEQYLQSERGLTIKPSWQINRCSHGVLYCGHRVTAGQIRLSPRRKRRYKQLRLAAERSYALGDISALELQQKMAAVHSVTLPADSAAWRAEHFRRTGVVDA